MPVIWFKEKEYSNKNETAGIKGEITTFGRQNVVCVWTKGPTTKVEENPSEETLYE